MLGSGSKFAQVGSSPLFYITEWLVRVLASKEAGKNVHDQKRAQNAVEAALKNIVDVRASSMRKLVSTSFAVQKISSRS